MNTIKKLMFAAVFAGMGLCGSAWAKNVASDPVLEELAKIFDCDNTATVVEPIEDADGELIGRKVVLGQDYGPLAFSNDFGAVTIDLNGWTIKGTNGVNGTATTAGGNGGPAIAVAGECEADAGPTAITVKDDSGVQLWENGPYFAKCNVGATKPEESGYYFWWGDTVGYTQSMAKTGWVSVKDGETNIQFSESDTTAKRTCNKDIDTLKSEGWIDEDNNLVATNDAATVHLGAPWRMMRKADFDAIVANCETNWMTQNGVQGWLVKGKGDYASKSIFLPVTGFGESTGLVSGKNGDYWSSTADQSQDKFAWYLCFDTSHFYANSGTCKRCNGLPVRAVREAVVEGRPAPGSAAVIAGGNGGNGNPPGQGGEAIVDGSGEKVTVVDPFDLVKKGDDGKVPAAPEGSLDNPWKVGETGAEDTVLAYTNGTGAVIVKGEGTPKSFGENEEPWADAQPPITRIIVPTGRGPEFREKWPAMADLIEEVQNYLAFTGAGEWGGSVSLNGTATCEDPLLETAFDVFGPWTPLAISEDKMSDMIELTPGKTVYFRRRDPIPVMNFSTTEYCWQFMIEGTVAASGNIMSLLDKTCQQTAVGERAFASLFSGRAEGLMSAPELPATDLAVECYSGMFSGCISLTNAPALPATTLARECYANMFNGCTALTDAPELPATTLAVWSCAGMFNQCTALTNVSRLAAREFCDCSAMAMFASAEKLNALTVEFDSWPTAKDATAGWLSEVAETGVFTCPIGLPVIKDANHIPEGWVVKKRFTLPVTMETGRYVVSNLTGEATLVEPIRTSGNDAIYEVTLDMSIGIYLEPAPGYVALGRNPLLLSDLSAGVDLYGMLPWTTLTPDGAGYRPWQWAETAYGYPRIDLLNDNGSHPWPLLDENCCPTGWAAYTNANGEVVFIGEGPLPEGFAEKPPFDDILPSAPKIIVPAGEADRFRTALPDFADKVTTLPQEDPLKALCIGIGSNAGCLNLNTAKSPDMASVLTTCHAEIVEAMRARPAVAPYLALAGNKVLDVLGDFYGEPEEVSAETEALRGIFAETVAAVDLLSAAPSGICVTAAAMLDRYDYRSEEMAQFKRELFSNFVAALPNRPLREVDALGQVGEAMISSIRYIGNPEQFPLITAAFTDAAEGLSGCLEAQALGTVAAQLMKSVARQPEAAGTLREAFADVVKLSRSVIGRTDVRAQALSKVATQLMDAIARQPGAAGTLREAFFDVVKSFAGRTGVQSLALGRIGGSLMDAIARQPEARGQLRGAFADVAEKVAGLSDVQACALSMVGGSLMDAMARQPEASNTILAACLDAAEAIRGKTDAQAEMLGKIGSSLMDAMARQPEARSQLRGAFADAMAMAGGLPDGEALALGKTGGSLMDAMARMPEVAGTLHAAFLDIAAAVDGRTESQALAIGRVGGNQMDAMARMPEKSSAIRDAVTNLVVKAIEQRSDAKALALGETGASLMDAIARQPEEYETLCSAFGTVVVAVDSCMSDAQAQALGRTGGGLMDAIARQPEETQNILKGFAVVKELTVVSPDAQAQMLGEIGEQLMVSIARQPTAADEMVEFFLLVGKEMQGGSEEWVSAIGNAAVIGVDTLARSPASFETLVKMFDVGEDTMRACTPRATPGIGLSLVGLASAMASYWQNPNIADELLVQQMNFDLLIRDVCWMVRIVSAESARTEGAWSGAAQVVYELRWLETDKPYALTFDLKAANQTGSCTTNLPKAVVDGVYTQEIYRTEFFGPESQVQDPGAELTLKLIEKSKSGK